MKKNTVVITKLPKDTYFQWFLLGFYELKNKKKIKLKFDISIILKLLCIIKNEYICALLRKLNNKIGKDGYNLEGYIKDINGKIKYFSIDCADSPYLFNSELLEKDSIYFKMQCPKKFDRNGFRLNNDVIIPWSDHNHENKNIKKLGSIGSRKICYNLFENIEKIKPLMIGPRRLSRSLNYAELKKGYKNLINNRNNKKEKKIMCYFGNAKGPIPNTNSPIDVDSEANIIGIYGEKIHHPNEKRYKIAKIIEAIGNENDVRIINKSNSDFFDKNNIKSEIIPLEDFPKHVSAFEYNLNVSGYRLSIPNRFIDSFSVGTSIVTDKLFVKWYKEFDKSEVVELDEMGYLKEKNVDWIKIKKQIKELPKNDSRKVIENFENKWNPEVVAKYILDEVLKVKPY